MYCCENKHTLQPAPMLIDKMIQGSTRIAKEARDCAKEKFTNVDQLVTLTQQEIADLQQRELSLKQQRQQVCRLWST